jgi:small subunit ribosomal protein S9
MATQQYSAAVGRRKSAIARARLVNGAGQIVVNGRPIEEYFGGPIWTAQAVEPLRTVNQLGQVNVDIRVVGGGRSGQAGATSHAIARALVKSDETLRLPLRRAGLLTRDAREKERKKYGLKRARKAPQYTKR